MNQQENNDDYDGQAYSCEYYDNYTSNRIVALHCFD